MREVETLIICTHRMTTKKFLPTILLKKMTRINVVDPKAVCRYSSANEYFLVESSLRISMNSNKNFIVVPSVNPKRRKGTTKNPGVERSRLQSTSSSNSGLYNRLWRNRTLWNDFFHFLIYVCILIGLGIVRNCDFYFEILIWRWWTKCKPVYSNEQ